MPSRRLNTSKLIENSGELSYYHEIIYLDYQNAPYVVMVLIKIPLEIATWGY